jgi:serine/threonine-protein phosphatase 5
MENYGLAITDCEEAVLHDPTYAKGHYRKAEALIALDKYKEASQCLYTVVFSLKNGDKEAFNKYKFVKKVIKERAFLAAISYDTEVVVDPKEIVVEGSYTGPVLEED